MENSRYASGKKFSTVEALRFAVYTIVEHILFFISALFVYVATLLGVGLVLAAVTIVPLGSRVKDIMDIVREMHATSTWSVEQLKALYSLILTGGFWTIIICLVFALTFVWFSLGYTKVALDFYDNGKSSIGRLFSQFRHLLTGAFATLAYYLIVAIGLAFFIVPGIIAAIVFGFYQYAIVDRNAGIFEAFAYSADITRGYRLQIFGFSIVLSVIRSLLWTIPGGFLLMTSTVLAHAYVYRKLQGK